MKINNKDIIELINNERQYIDNYVLETTKGTKAMKNKFHHKAVIDRNTYVSSKIKEYENYKMFLSSEINKRVNKIFPKDNNELFSKNRLKIDQLCEIIKLNNKYGSINYKLGLTKLIHDLNDFDNTNLVEINTRIKEIIKILNNAGIKLSLDLFAFSSYTYEYMNCFLDNINSNNFDNIMQKSFEDIYWECPKLIDHIRLNFNYIVNKFQKNLNDYTNNLIVNKLKKNKIENKELFDKYDELLTSLNNSINIDPYTLVNKFLNKEKNVYDYLVESSVRISNYNHLAKNNNFNTLTDEEKKDFYDQTIDFGDTLKELEKYYLFKPIIDDLKKRYLSKNDYLKEYNLKIKNILNEENKREKLYKKYIASLKGNFFKKINLKSIDLNKLNLITQIDNLEKLYSELDNMEIDVNINRYIDNTSSIYDLLLVAFSSYKYLKEIYTDVYLKNDYTFSLEYFMNELFSYLFNNTNNFIYKTSIESDIDIIESISNKFNLLNINVSNEELEKDNLSKIIDVLDMINTINNIDNSSINLDDILFIYEAKNL